MPQPDAERRVNEVTTQAKAAADTARKGAAKLAFWMTAGAPVRRIFRKSRCG
jgi:hypothetical protein